MGAKCWGPMMSITYDCVGKGKMEILTSEGASIKRSLILYIKEKDIKIGDINEVCYNYDPIDYKKSAKELGIPDRPILTLKLKSDFNR